MFSRRWLVPSVAGLMVLTGSALLLDPDQPILISQVTGPGQPMTTYPYSLPIDPPHKFHSYPPSAPGSDVDADGGVTILIPDEVPAHALYGAWWPVPDPPAPGARLVGLLARDITWEGRAVDVRTVVTVTSKVDDGNAKGLVTGAGIFQGIDGELVAAALEPNSSAILVLREPVADVREGDYIVSLDVEDVAASSGDESQYPTSISVGTMEWQWTLGSVPT